MRQLSVIALLLLLTLPLVGQRQPAATPPVVLITELPPVQPYTLPFQGVPAGTVKYIRVPSNQDIKDGVQRPIDTLDWYVNYHIEAFGFAPR